MRKQVAYVTLNTRGWFGWANRLILGSTHTVFRDRNTLEAFESITASGFLGGPYPTLQTGSPAQSELIKCP